MEVQVDVDEADVGKVKEGQQATFSVDAYPGPEIPGAIRELRFGSEVVQGVVTYKAVLSTDNSELLLRPGMTATAEIIVQESPTPCWSRTPPFDTLPPVTPSDKTSFLQRVLPGPPPFRPASQQRGKRTKPQGVGPEEWHPVAVPVVMGCRDGQRTEIVKGDIKEEQGVIVDRRQPNREAVPAGAGRPITAPALIELRAVTKVYGQGDAAVHALAGADLKIGQGEFAAIMGPSGSGKSTAMNIIGCLDTPSSGSYLLQGHRRRAPEARPAGTVAAAFSGIRVSGVQSASPHIRHRER